MPILSGRRHIKKLHVLARDKMVDLWAVDEVRFEQRGTACRMLVPLEIKDPVLLHHPSRDGVGYFGAVRIRDGKFVYSHEEKRSNAMTLFTFLKSFAGSLAIPSAGWFLLWIMFGTIMPACKKIALYVPEEVCSAVYAALQP